MTEMMAIAMAAIKGAENMSHAPEAISMITIPTIVIMRDNQYPSFFDLTVLLRVPLNLSAIPISPKGISSKLNVAVAQPSGWKNDSGGKFTGEGSVIALVNQ